MASPKSGNKCAIVPPTAPKAAIEADEAEPGAVEKLKANQREDKAGKYGQVEAKKHKPEEEKQNDKEKKKTWLDIELADEEKNPIPGEKFVVKLANGQEYEGTLNDEGKARVDGIDPENAKIKFPSIDENAWNDAQ